MINVNMDCDLSYVYQQKFLENFTQTCIVKNEIELREKLNDNNLTNYSKIFLANDITIFNDLDIKNKNVKIDLNGHKLILADPNIKINIGCEKLKGVSTYQIYHPGHYETKEKIKIDSNGKKTFSYDKTWIPGYYETKYKNEYEYPKIAVSFINGTIEKTSFNQGQLNGNSPKDAYWFSEANGKSGLTPTAVFNVISGTLFVEKSKIIGANGGDGGNATYSAIWHTPFLGINGGDGGNGGNAGNGGNIYNCLENGKITIDSFTQLNAKPGTPGTPGKGSNPNPNYWFIEGSTGHDGKNGEDGKIINDENKLTVLPSEFFIN